MPDLSAQPRQLAETAPLWRRAAALFYDSLFVIALVFLATALALIPFGGEAIPGEGPLQWLFRVYLLVWVAGYFVYFWCKFGQTPGMKVWRIMLYPDQTKRCAATMTLRFFWGIACILSAGLLFFAALRSEKRQTWFEKRMDMRVIKFIN